MHIQRSLTLCCVLLVALIVPAQSEDWPKGYIVAPGSESPDGRYGILIESKESALDEMNKADEAQPDASPAATAAQTPDENKSATTDDADEEEGADEDEGYINYVADLKSHHIIGKIKGSDYFQGQNHRGFSAEWSNDSKLCVAIYEDRYGFGSIIVLEPVDDHVNQVEIGEKVQNSCDATVKKRGEYNVDLSAYFRFESAGKIRVRAFGQDNPKQLEPTTHYALFRGTYDYPAKKWTAAEAHSIKSELNDELGYAFEKEPARRIFVGDKPPDDFEGQVVATEEEKVKALDEQLNHVYSALRMLMPPAQFAKVKADEKEWVKQLEATKAAKEKSDLIAARIQKLQDFLWQ